VFSSQKVLSASGSQNVIKRRVENPAKAKLCLAVICYQTIEGTIRGRGGANNGHFPRLILNPERSSHNHNSPLTKHIALFIESMVSFSQRLRYPTNYPFLMPHTPPNIEKH
tara:strand:+ start:644 stop:976 length:333 start_codon:yes stop_codon:yes gene_type:complete